MKSTPPGEIMCRAHIADQAPATKEIEAWKYYQDNHYTGCIAATIMCMTLPYQSMDCLQDN